MSTLQRKKQIQWISSIPVHIINLDQNQSHLFIQVHHADAFFKEILLVFKLIKSVTTYSKTSQKKQIITL